MERKLLLDGKLAVYKDGRVCKVVDGKEIPLTPRPVGYESYGKPAYVGVGFEGKTYSIHRLMAMAFLENPDNKPQVNHIDGDRTNNDLSNLEWVTSRENVRHAIKTGLKKHAAYNMNPIKRRRLQLGITQAMLASKLGVPTTKVSAIEKDQAPIPSDYVEKLANALRWETDYLVAHARVTTTRRGKAISNR